MDLFTVSENLAKFSKQLSILQDYITIKFGVDFEEFYKTRSQEGDNLLVTKVCEKTHSVNNSTSSSSRVSRPQPQTMSMTTRCHNSMIPTSSVGSEFRLHTGVDIKTEDDFFDENDDCSDGNMDNEDDDPLDPDFDIVERMDTFQEDSNLSLPEEDSEGHHCHQTGHVSCKRRSCGRKRKSMKTKQPPPVFDSSNRLEIETETPGLKVFPSSRGKGNYAVIFKGFLYTFRKNGSQKRIFRCTKEDSLCCKSRLHLSWDYKTVVCEKFTKHNHSCNPAEGDIKYAMWKMKCRASETEEPLGEIVSSELAQVAASCQDFLPNLHNLKRAVRNARATKDQMVGFKEVIESKSTPSQFQSSSGEPFINPPPPQGSNLVLENECSEPNEGNNGFS